MNVWDLTGSWRQIVPITGSKWGAIKRSSWDFTELLLSLSSPSYSRLIKKEFLPITFLFQGGIFHFKPLQPHFVRLETFPAGGGWGMGVFYTDWAQVKPLLFQIPRARLLRSFWKIQSFGLAAMPLSERQQKPFSLHHLPWKKAPGPGFLGNTATSHTWVQGRLWLRIFEIRNRKYESLQLSHRTWEFRFQSSASNRNPNLTFPERLHHP